MNKKEEAAKKRMEVLTCFLSQKKELEKMAGDESIPSIARMCIFFSLGCLEESNLTLVTKH